MFDEKTAVVQTMSSLKSFAMNSSMYNVRKVDPRGPVNIKFFLRYFEKKTTALTGDDRVNIVSDYLEGSALDIFIEEIIDISNLVPIGK